MEIMQISPVELLTRCLLFKGVSRSEIEPLALQCAWLELRKHQPLFFQGDPVDQVYLVQAGLVKVYRLDPRGKRQIVLHQSFPGQCVAALAVFLQQPTYPCSAEAAEASRVLVIPAEALGQLAQKNVAFANNMLETASQHTRQIVQVLDRMVFCDVDSRLAEYLLSMTKTYGQGFKLPTNQEIAAVVGTTPEPVSRKLGHFSQQGWIAVRNRKLSILNKAALLRLRFSY
jgi:CRP/FNR family transcriptional regulator